MAYDEDLADRLREALQERDGVVEKKMFGGLAFLIGGHMAVAASGKGGLMVRCDPAETEAHLAQGAEPMEMKGRGGMRGWLRVDDHAVDDAEFARWVEVGASYAAGLPPK